MKKLMIAATAVAATFAANAISIKWGDSAINDLDGNPVEDDTTTMYSFFFGTDSAAYDYITTTYTDVSKGQQAIYNGFTAKTGKLTINGVAYDVQDSAGVDVSDAAAVSDSETVDKNETYYFANIFTYDQDGDGEIDYYKANIATKEMGTKSYEYDLMATNWGGEDGSSAMSWQKIESVPEPFSGTLALLGMGAIALRRKLRKAKKA